MTSLQKDIRIPPLERIKGEPPSLVDLAIHRAATKFEAHETVKQILKNCGLDNRMETVYEHLDLEMPLKVACSRINNEAYWKRRALFLRGNNEPHKHGNSWKILYCEHFIQECLENLELDPPQEVLDKLKEDLLACGPYIHQLNLKQLPSHYEISALFSSLPGLTKVSISFGPRRLGMNYDRAAMGMKMSDAMSVTRMLRTHRLLTSLSLPCNLIDDELVKILMEGLKYAPFLTHLDLSHNKISDVGARRISRLLDKDSKHCLFSLDLSDNQIHPNGALHLGVKLAENEILQKLNLRLNRIGDEGAEHFFSDLRTNKAIRILNISANNISYKSIHLLSQSLMHEDCSLVELDISSNPIYPSITAAQQLSVQISKLSSGAAEVLSNAVIGSSSSNKHLSSSRNLKNNNRTHILEEEFAVKSPEEEAASDACSHFVQALNENKSLHKLDLRSCNLPSDVLTASNTAVMTKYLNEKKIPLEAWKASVAKLQQAEEDLRLKLSEVASSKPDGDETVKEGKQESSDETEDQDNVNDTGGANEEEILLEGAISK